MKLSASDLRRDVPEAEMALQRLHSKPDVGRYPGCCVHLGERNLLGFARPLPDASFVQSVAVFPIPGHCVLHRETMTDKFEDIRTFIATGLRICTMSAFSGRCAQMCSTAARLTPTS